MKLHDLIVEHNDYCISFHVKQSNNSIMNTSSNKNNRDNNIATLNAILQNMAKRIHHVMRLDGNFIQENI